MKLTEALNRKVSPMGWSAEEELIIATIQRTEFVPRPEAIRLMQRRKHASRRLTASRLCRNPRCTRGEDRGPGSLAHLRVDALYCNATCKKAGQRSLKRENRGVSRQCLSGCKGDKSVSVALPLQADE
jgi:hypothetical protein